MCDVYDAKCQRIQEPDESENGNKLARRAKESKDLVLHLRTQQ